MNIYVGNLNFRVSENDLSTMFGKYGIVTSSKIITDKSSGKSKGFGFIEMRNQDEGNKAIKGLNGIEFQSRNLVVNEAKPKRTAYER